jgi:hypothetical protein
VQILMQLLICLVPRNTHTSSASPPCPPITIPTNSFTNWLVFLLTVVITAGSLLCFRIEISRTTSRSSNDHTLRPIELMFHKIYSVSQTPAIRHSKSESV